MMCYCPFCELNSGRKGWQPMNIKEKDTVTGIITLLCPRCLDQDGKIGAERFTKDGIHIYQTIAEVP